MNENTDLCSVSKCVGGHGARSKMCNRHRYLLAKYGCTDTRIIPLVCVACSKTFVPTRVDSPAYCSTPTCLAERKKYLNRERERAYFVEHGEYRSRAAERADPEYKQKAAARDKARNAAVPIRKRYPGLARARDARRRMRKMGNASDVVPFRDADVFKRDGWVCQLCGDPVDRRLQYPAEKSKSIDHIVPLAKDGAHTFENVQLAHFDCNRIKRDRIVAPLALSL